MNRFYQRLKTNAIHKNSEIGRMTTIKKEIQAQGNTLMKNYDCKVVIKPSCEGKIRIFVKDGEPFEACIENVVSTEHYVTLADSNKKTILGGYKHKAGLCEHFMAACAILRIDSLDVYLSEEEFPIFDGSAKEWIRLFKESGITGNKKTNLYTVSEPVYYLNGKTSMVILPDKDLNITYSVNYDHKDLHNQWVSFNKKNIEEIIEARTFGFYKDLKNICTGFFRGLFTKNYQNSDFKFGLYILSATFITCVLGLFIKLDMKCQILVKEAGHAVHIKTARMLKDKLVKL